MSSCSHPSLRHGSLTSRFARVSLFLGLSQAYDPFTRKAATSAIVKTEQVSDDDSFSLTPFKLSKAKGKSRARMTTPIEVSSDDDVGNRPTRFCVLLFFSVILLTVYL